MELERGDKIGEYRILRKLGEGGMGEVYLAIHEALDQKVVIKRLHADLSNDEEMRARFHREAEALARLNHPNIVHIYNFFEAPEGACIVMEYVEGETFEQLIERTGLIPPARAVQLILPVLSAMAYAHQHGVIHRDIKPANLMLLHDTGEVRVLDFGTAKVADRPGLTRVGMTLGTATYMAPEQLLGKPLTPAADIYAIGVTLYEMCTGRLPFESEDTADLVRKVLREQPVSPRVFYPLIPERLEQIILRCLAKRPEDRYERVEDLERELRALLKELAQQTVMGLKPARPRGAAAAAGSGVPPTIVASPAPPRRPATADDSSPTPAPREPSPPQPATHSPAAAPTPASDTHATPSPQRERRDRFPLGFTGVLWALLATGTGILLAGAGVFALLANHMAAGVAALIGGALLWLGATAALALSVVQLDERNARLRQAPEGRDEPAESGQTAAPPPSQTAAPAAEPPPAAAAAWYGYAGWAPAAAAWGYPAPAPWPLPAPAAPAAYGAWAAPAPTGAEGRGGRRLEKWRHVPIEPEVFTPERLAALSGEHTPAPRRKTRLLSEDEAQALAGSDNEQSS